MFSMGKRLTISIILLGLLVSTLAWGAAAPRASALSTARILVTGDSITQGSSGDYTWRYRLWQKLQSTGAAGTSFVGTRNDLYDNVNDRSGSQYYATPFVGKTHAAQWGTTYQAQVDQIDGQVRAANPDILVVMLGSNDLAYISSPEQTIVRVEQYIARARAVKPNIKLVLGQVITRWDWISGRYTLVSETADYSQRLDALRQRLSTSASPIVVARTGQGWDARQHTYDGTHPNATGEGVIAQRVSEALSQLGVGSQAPDISGPRAWLMPGPTPTVTPGSEAATLTWQRVTTGANAMYIEQRLTNINGAWERLPYPVSGDTFTPSYLAAGGTYQFRLAPTKYWMEGVVGPAAQRLIGGPTPGTAAWMSAVPGGDSLYGGKTVRTQWAAAQNASGYMVASYNAVSGSYTRQELPYPVPGGQTSWVFDAMSAGWYKGFEVRPVRGFLSASRTGSNVVRTRGISGDRAYVALGDSYSSGQGAEAPGNYTGGACLRTNRAWPYQMQSSWNRVTYHVACSGSVIDSVPGQIATARSRFNESAAQGRPQMISLTIGGNDLDWGGVVVNCALALNCASLEGQLNARVDSVGSRLTGTYGNLRSQFPYADIIVGGYPGLVEPSGVNANPVCLGLVSAERYMMQRLSARFNDRIDAAASANYNVWSAATRVEQNFAGKNACANWADEQIHSLDPDSETGTFNSVNSFHPKWGGQYLYGVSFSDTIIASVGQ